MAIGDEMRDIGNGIKTSFADLEMSRIQKDFKALFSPEIWSLVEKGALDVEGIRQSFYRLKTDESVREFTKQMQDMRDELELADAERFARRATESMLGVVPLQQIVALREQAIEVYGAIEAHRKLQNQIATGISLSEQFVSEEDKVRQSIDAVRAAYEAKEISTKKYQDATVALQGQLKMMNPIFQSIESVVQSATNSMTSALVSMFTGAEKARDAFRNFFGGLANMILGEVMKMIVVIPIMNAIRAALGMPTVPQITPAMADAASFGPSAYSLNQPGATAGFSQRAGGGAIMAGMPTLVGERGPELFVPHSAGKIVNGNNTASLMRQSPPVVVNQTVQVTTGVQNTVRAEIQNLLPQIAEVTKAAVQQSALRGGSFKRAFA
jgi:hypothetical protein